MDSSRTHPEHAKDQLGRLSYRYVVPAGPNPDWSVTRSVIPVDAGTSSVGAAPMGSTSVRGHEVHELGRRQ